MKIVKQLATRPYHPPSSTSLLARVAQSLDALRPSEKAVARFVLDHPRRVIDLSFPAIANLTGVSQPTVARFCQAMGVAGFREFKLRLAQSLAHGVPYVHHDVAAGDSMADAAAKVFDRAIAALTEARNYSDAAAMARAVAMLARAKRIEFYGAGNSGIVAMDAQIKFFRLGVPANAYNDPHVHAMAATLLRKGDVVVAISASGRSADLLRSAAIARESGARLIAITAGGSPLARLADVALLSEPSEDLQIYAPMTSRLVHLVLLDALAVGVALQRGPALAAKLKRAKAAVGERMV
jgi:RpiR family carbohydrate utilization transcriptional regulator